MVGIAVVVVLYAVFVTTQILAYKSASTKHVVSAQEFESLRPTQGFYRVEGGRMAWERVEGGTFFVGGTVIRKATYRSYLPFMDLKTDNLILLIEMIGDDANPVSLHENVLPPGAVPAAETVEGTLYSSDEMDADVLQDFATRHFPIPPGTPVLRLFDMPTNKGMIHRIEIATVVMLLIVVAPFISIFMSGGGKPKKRRPEKYAPSWRR